MKNNKGKNWTKSDISQLKQLAKKGVYTTDIAKKIGRTIPAVYTKASDENISLKPKDK